MKIEHTTTKTMLVASDLDGTLLDHFNYSWEAASPSLKKLKALGVPVIINTSKTFAEVVGLQQALGMDTAFIVENGSAIYIPSSSVFADKFNEFNTQFNRLQLGTERDTIVDALSRLRQDHGFQFESYNDWSVEDVMGHTGLSHENATLSKARQFSEPLIWQDSDEQFELFSQLIKAQSLRLIRGGRFLHVLGLSDKGASLQTLRDILFTDKTCTMVCLGDSYNDLDMLEIADIPIFVRSPVHDFPAHQCQQTPIFTKGFGPVGWHEAMLTVLNSINV